MTKLEQEYAEIMRDKKVLAAREKLIKEKLEKKYGQNAVSKKTPLGTFKMIGRKTWTYSQEVTEMAEDLKIAQIDEQENETADYVEKFSLRFNPKKEK